MTNNEIIFWSSVELMNQGILGTTGRVFKGKDPEGNPVELMEPEQIHTFQAWKERGYIVKKGEKSIATIRIWKYSKKTLGEVPVTNLETGETTMEMVEKENMFKKDAYFFKASQVEKIA
jgi:hypothetical protein